MNYAKLIDNTTLHADATKADIEKLCNEAKELDTASVCVNPDYIELSAKLLKGTDVKVCTVIGFPLGSMTTEAKVFEAKDAVNKGADEVDMVINVSKIKDQEYDYVLNEIREIKNAIKEHTLKVILETCLLTKEEIVKACELSKEAGADFVKTSTGFSTAGAKVEDVQLMRKTVGSEMGVKASGGIRTPEDLKNMVEAGANRIGASHGKNLVE
ncbi:MAG: deoxyribose-phosphate aldolase [Bacillales bacterium]